MPLTSDCLQPCHIRYYARGRAQTSGAAGGDGGALLHEHGGTARRTQSGPRLAERLPVEFFLPYGSYPGDLRLTNEEGRNACLVNASLYRYAGHSPDLFHLPAGEQLCDSRRSQLHIAAPDPGSGNYRPWGFR